MSRDKDNNQNEEALSSYGKKIDVVINLLQLLDKQSQHQEQFNSAFSESLKGAQEQLQQLKEKVQESKEKDIHFANALDILSEWKEKHDEHCAQLEKEQREERRKWKWYFLGMLAAIFTAIILRTPIANILSRLF